MQEPAEPADEAQRLQTLQALGLLDTPPEERFDRFTRLARRLFGVAVASITLVDASRQWFKSIQGLDLREAPRRISFCGHAILSDELLLVPDARLDERFADNPLVRGEPFIRFYAGQPLHAPDGQRIGTLCLIDHEARTLEDEDRALLKDLAQMVEHEIALLQLATVDELTGLSNRRGFETLARHALGLAQRQASPATLLFFDLDRFKAINDLHGHAEGDAALRAFAQLLRQTFRESDLLARLGGDEFAVLVIARPGGDIDPALPRPGAALQRLLASVERFNAARLPGQWQLHYSAGAAAFDPAEHADAAALLAAADRLMYKAKANGRSRR